MRTLIASALVAATLTGCAASGPETAERSPKAQQLLASYLDGKTPGQAISCLPHYRADDQIVIDENTILFRDGPNRVWRTEMTGGCMGLGSPGKAIVTRSFGGTGLCRGEIARVVDNVAGFTTGSCSFGDFVPYVTPGKGGRAY